MTDPVSTMRNGTWPVRLAKRRLQRRRLPVVRGCFVRVYRVLLPGSRQRPEAVEGREVKRWVEADRPGKGDLSVVVAPTASEEYSLNYQRQRGPLHQRHHPIGDGTCMNSGSHLTGHLLLRGGQRVRRRGSVRRRERCSSPPRKEQGPARYNQTSRLVNGLMEAKQRWIGDNHIDPR